MHHWVQIQFKFWCQNTQNKGVQGLKKNNISSVVTFKPNTPNPVDVAIFFIATLISYTSLCKEVTQYVV